MNASHDRRSKRALEYDMVSKAEAELCDSEDAGDEADDLVGGGGWLGLLDFWSALRLDSLKSNGE